MYKLLIFHFLLLGTIFSQAQDLKKLALDEFRKEHYRPAIELLQKALKQNSKDPEIYYYLGVFTHYQCYDSTPLRDFNQGNSDSVLSLLKKAVDLKPDYGDAYYFIGAEYGARAVSQMFYRNAAGIKKEFVLSRKSGALPDWLLEYARNILRSCEENAILFTGGDSEFNPVLYLQIIEHFRTDVTAIPIGLLDRPWFIHYLKTGLSGISKPVSISLTDRQIYDLHPYKWKSTLIVIPVPDTLREKYKIINTSWKWELNPDLKRDERDLLSSHGAILLNILQTNEWKRPVYFTLGCHDWMFFGLNKFFQLNGLVTKILPFETINSEFTLNNESSYNLLAKSDNFVDLKTIKTYDMPRISKCVLNYLVTGIKMAGHCIDKKQYKQAENILSLMDKNIPVDFCQRNNEMKKEIERIIEIINKHHRNNPVEE